MAAVERSRVTSEPKPTYLTFVMLFVVEANSVPQE
jgi:hypothetical protein